MMAKRIILYPHGGSGNHGCEAIVRSTVDIIRNQHAIILFSSNEQEDCQYGLDRVCRILPARRGISRLSINYLKARIQYRRGDHEAFDRISFRPILEKAVETDLALSIGGDNYCYGTPTHLLLVNKELRKSGVKTVLWGCSIEPEVMRGDILSDLRDYTHIIVRESITFQALVGRGIRNVSLLPDPAFQLKRTDLPLPDGFVEGNTVGVNVSPLVIAHEQSSGIVLANYRKMIRRIIDTTDMQIALVPHVVWSHNDDREPLRILYKEFKETNRVVMIGDHNAEELKGFIARCRFMVVARTHASIAAYSEQVPTLVIGYSVKARGIARDLFGTEERYVLPVQALRHEDALAQAFCWIYDHEEGFKQLYKQVMPTYIARAREAGGLLELL